MFGFSKPMDPFKDDMPLFIAIETGVMCHLRLVEQNEKHYATPVIHSLAGEALDINLKRYKIKANERDKNTMTFIALTIAKDTTGFAQKLATQFDPQMNLKIHETQMEEAKRMSKAFVLRELGLSI